MIPVLIILLTIHGTNAMYGDSCSDTPASQYIVQIWYFMKHKCSGSILDRVHILTAGHCVTDQPTSLLTVVTGSTERGNLQVISVETVRFHDDFDVACPGNISYWKNDIAVLKLSEPLTWGPTLRAVQLIDKGYTWGLGTIRQLYGWGHSPVNYVESSTLQWCYATFMEKEACRASHVDLLENEGCLINPLQSTALEDRDQGAPITVRGIATGITIRGGEHESSPIVFLRIYPYLDFIASVLNVKDFNIPGNFPHYVAILYNGLHHCSGSIIDSSHILTAAHCFDDFIVANMAVLPGHSEFFVASIPVLQLSFIHRIQNHPLYNRTVLPGGLSILVNDISVVTVLLTWSDTISAIGLADYSPIWKTCQLYRWSRTITAQAKKVEQSWWSSAKIYDYDTCRRLNTAVTPQQFCVVNLYSLSIATEGDSGSPIVCDGMFIVGVYNGRGAIDRPASAPFEGLFYTSILPYREFISDAVANKFEDFYEL